MTTQLAVKKFSNEDLTKWKREINPAPIIGTRIKLRRENAEYIGCCPDVYHVSKAGHQDKHPSFKIYKMDDGVWGFKCFSCGANGNVFQFVQAFDGIKFKDAVVRVLAEAGVEGFAEEGHPVRTFAPDDTPQKEHITFPIKEYAPAMAAFEKATRAHKWLANRGITLETARRFKLGYVQNASKVTPANDWINDGWILFPTLSADHQVITAVKYRSLVAKKEKRPDGCENSGILRALNTSTTMFNMGAVVPNEDVWIVEGEPDTMVTAQAGENAVGLPMGEYKPTAEEIEMLSSVPKRRFIAGDNDAIGMKAVELLKKRLRGETYVITWPNNRKDANDVLTNECGNDPAKFSKLLESLKSKALHQNPYTESGNSPPPQGADKANDAFQQSGGTPPSYTVSGTADHIVPKKIVWLWPNRIAQKLNLIVGNPDLGKGLITYYVTSCITTGQDWFDAKNTWLPSEVLLLSGEEDWDDTIVPRLMAAGADLTKVHWLKMSPRENDSASARELHLDRDADVLESFLVGHPDVRLVIVDPISNYLGDAKMIDEQKVRADVLTPLKEIANRQSVAVIGVMHLNKKVELDAINRVGGAMAFVGVARMVWLVAPRLTEGDTPSDELLMVKIKGNIVQRDLKGLAYKTRARAVTIEGAPVMTPYVEWTGEVDQKADELTHGGHPKHPAHRPAEQLPAAEKWVVEYLKDGSKPLDDIESAGKALHGFSVKTIQRARESVGVVTFANGKRKASDGKMRTCYSCKLNEAQIVEQEETPF